MTPHSPISQAIDTTGLPATFATQFCHSPDKDYSVKLTGHLHSIWHRPRWIFPLLWLLQKAGILISECGQMIPTTLEVSASVDPLGNPIQRWQRRFYGKRIGKFDVVVVYDPHSHRAIDLVGHGGFLALGWEIRHQEDELHIHVVQAGLRLGRTYLWFPNLIWPLLLGRETFVQRILNEDSGHVSINLNITHPILGKVFGYHGEFLLEKIPGTKGQTFSQKNPLRWWICEAVCHVRQKRWLAQWREDQGSLARPVFYHCISRVVERRFAFDEVAKEKFRTLMRLIEKFSGCRVVAYCIMCNHFHVLLEVPPMPEGGLSDAELLKRLRVLYRDDVVNLVATELATARAGNHAAMAEEVHRRYTYRMHDLGEFMKALLQRFTQWFNRMHQRKGHLWEDRFKSVIVEDGHAAITMTAYIDLNPVRAGMVDDPAKYRWSSYGEAIGGGTQGHGLSARAGLVRALRGHLGVAADAALWAQGVSRQYRRLLMAGAEQVESLNHDAAGKEVRRSSRKGICKETKQAAAAKDGEMAFAQALRHRIRYFTDGAVIGSRAFVDELFTQARERFGPKRKDGARKLRGAASALGGLLWSLRDLKQGTS